MVLYIALIPILIHRHLLMLSLDIALWAVTAAWKLTVHVRDDCEAALSNIAGDSVTVRLDEFTCT